MTPRRVLSPLCLAVCAIGFAGCGGDTLSFDPVAKAASTTVDSQSARVAFFATMDVDGIGGMSFNGAGLFDGRSRAGALNLRFTLPADAQAQLGGVAPTMQMIVDGRSGLVMYMRSPLFRPLPAGKWVKFDMQRLAKKAGIDLSSVLSANQADPSQSLQMLTASSDAHAVGYDRVRGVFTTHYTLKVDLNRLAKEHKDLAKSYDAVRRVTGADSFPAEAWIDDQGRIRRLKLDLSFNGPTGAAFRMSMTEELYAFGIKADIRPPAANQVIDASALLGG